MDQHQVAIIVSSVLASTCVILIILVVYLFHVVRRKPELQTHKIEPVDFPRFTPVPQPVQPSLIDGESSSNKHKQEPRHSYAGIDENLEANLDTSIYGPDMDEFYHNPNVKPKYKSNLKKSQSKWRTHSKSVEDLECEPLPDKRGSSLNHKFSKSTDNLDSSLGRNRYSRGRKLKKNRHQLTNCLSIHNINTPPCQRFKPRNRQTWHSHHRELSPLLRKSTPSTSLESLNNLEPCHGDEISQSIMNNSSERPSLGEILVALCHNPSEGKLTVTIKSAEGLTAVSKGKINSFIKIKVYDCGERKYSKRTTVTHDTTSPVFEESFDFVVTGSRMPQTSVMLRLYHHGHRVNVLSKNVLIGIVFLGSQDQLELIASNPLTIDEGATHWASIIEKPHLTIEEWHTIKVSPCAKDKIRHCH